MLSEPEMFFSVQTNVLEINVDLIHKVAESFVIDETCLDSLADLNLFSPIVSFLLLFSAQQRQLGVGNIFELGMAFILRIYKVLNLCELELSDPNESISRCNLISEAETNSASTKGYSSSIELEQFMEVNEDTLSCFWSQIASEIGGRSNFSLEHQIELLGC